MSKGIVCKASEGQTIDSFASELMEIRKNELGVLVGIFNDIPVFVHSEDTMQEIVENYLVQRKKILR